MSYRYETVMRMNLRNWVCIFTSSLSRPPPFRGPPQQFDYQHQRSEFDQFEGRGPPPSMVNEYNHGRPKDEEGYGMDEYDMPPEPPPPEPIIPTALYYELPAGLMAPLVGVRILQQLQSLTDKCVRDFLFSCCKVLFVSFSLLFFFVNGPC